MSQVTDWAIGLGFSFGAIKHFYPPQWDCTQGNFRAALGTRFVVVNQILPTVVTLQCIPGIGAVSCQRWVTRGNFGQEGLWRSAVRLKTVPGLCFD
jgi:hypothetical protein